MLHNQLIIAPSSTLYVVTHSYSAFSYAAFLLFFQNKSIILNIFDELLFAGEIKTKFKKYYPNSLFTFVCCLEWLLPFSQYFFSSNQIKGTHHFHLKQTGHVTPYIVSV